MKIFYVRNDWGESWIVMADTENEVRMFLQMEHEIIIGDSISIRRLFTDNSEVQRLT